MQNSVILRFFMGLFQALILSLKNSKVLRFFSAAGFGLAAGAKNSDIVRVVYKAGLALSLEESQRRSGLLRLLSHAVYKLADVFAHLYEKVRRLGRHSFCHAIYLHLIKPVDSIFNAFYLSALVGAGMLAVILMKSLILTRIGSRFWVYALALFVLCTVIGMGDRLRRAVSRSFFVRLLGRLFE